MGLDSIFKVFVPKERVFYPFFEKIADNLVVLAELLNKVMMTEDIAERDEYIKKIKEQEIIGDELLHEVFDLLHKTFITPFDREDIQGLVNQMDDVADYINSAAQRIKLYRPARISPELVQMGRFIHDATKQISIAIPELKHIKNREKITNACIKIDAIESQADDLYNFAISELFSKEKDATELIKNKEILESLERATDQAEDVSDVLKTILIKSA